MKAFALSIYVVFLFFTSCGNDESAFAVKQKLSSANRAEISFPKGKKIQLGSEKAELRILKNSISENDFDGKDCAADGKITFYTQDILVETLEFSVKPNCSFVYYLYKDQPFKKTISPEAEKYLLTLSNNN